MVIYQIRAWEYMLIEVNEMETEKYKASCPICGRNLFRGTPSSHVEVNCPKCGAFLQVAFEQNGYTVETTGTRAEVLKGKATV